MNKRTIFLIVYGIYLLGIIWILNAADGATKNNSELLKEEHKVCTLSQKKEVKDCL